MKQRNSSCSVRCFLLAMMVCASHAVHAQLKRIKHFGPNKGHLKMYVHIPAGMDPLQPAPLVVMLHGCLQCAGSAASQTDWNRLAEEHRFYMVYPQQRMSNNLQKCFRWYKRRHLKKGKGENASIMSMVMHMKKSYAIDSSRVFITGLSAGAAMSVIMMADYPETFHAGAIFAGGPYKVANGMVQGMMSLMGWRLKSPQQWADLVRKQHPTYRGRYPRMIIYQGSNDKIVNRRNAHELMEQWTALQGIPSHPSESIPFFLNNPDIERNAYHLPQETEGVVLYRVSGLGHALPVDPGSCSSQGGRRGIFSRDKDYFSTLWTAYDFGLIPAPLISGKKTVAPREKGLMYVVPANPDATYEWSFPAGCVIQGTANGNVVFADWGSSPGFINVTETDGKGCRKRYKTLAVHVAGP